MPVILVAQVSNFQTKTYLPVPTRDTRSNETELHLTFENRLNVTCLPVGMTEETCQIQLANRIKFGFLSFRSIEHERVHDFHSKQFSC